MFGTCVAFRFGVFFGWLCCSLRVGIWVALRVCGLGVCGLLGLLWCLLTCGLLVL